MISNNADGSSLLARRYFRGLDGLRGIAIGVVMMHHFVTVTDVRSGPLRVLHVFEEGWAGVDLFFVLSGFLITGILLDGNARAVPLRIFYARRALRIFPLYYCALCLVFLVPFGSRILGQQPASPTHSLWLWTYLTNVPMTFGFAEPRTEPLYVAHFWTLAIEEQFYLIWPWVTLAVSESRLRIVALLCLPLSLCVKALLLRAGIPPIHSDFFTLVRMDGLCVGALLACVIRRRPALPRFKRNSVIAALALAVTCVLSFGARPMLPYLTRLTNHLLLALLFGAITAVVVSSPDNAWINRVLGVRPLVWLGRRSYGLYVWHFLLLGVATRGLRGSGFLHGGSVGEAEFISALFLLSCLVAAVSWRLIEERFILAKRRFEYVDGR